MGGLRRSANSLSNVHLPPIHTPSESSAYTSVCTTRGQRQWGFFHPRTKYLIFQHDHVHHAHILSRDCSTQPVFDRTARFPVWQRWLRWSGDLFL